MEKYFKRISTLIWHELENNETVSNEYKFIQHNRNEFIIQNSTYNFLILDSTCIKTGRSIHELKNKIYEGKWIKD